MPGGGSTGAWRSGHKRRQRVTCHSRRIRQALQGVAGPWRPVPGRRVDIAWGRESGRTRYHRTHRVVHPRRAPSWSWIRVTACMGAAGDRSLLALLKASAVRPRSSVTIEDTEGLREIRCNNDPPCEPRKRADTLRARAAYGPARSTHTPIRIGAARGNIPDPYPHNQKTTTLPNHIAPPPTPRGPNPVEQDERLRAGYGTRDLPTYSTTTAVR